MYVTLSVGNPEVLGSLFQKPHPLHLSSSPHHLVLLPPRFSRPHPRRACKHLQENSHLIPTRRSAQLTIAFLRESETVPTQGFTTIVTRRVSLLCPMFPFGYASTGITKMRVRTRTGPSVKHSQRFAGQRSAGDVLCRSLSIFRDAHERRCP